MREALVEALSSSLTGMLLSFILVCFRVDVLVTLVRVGMMHLSTFLLCLASSRLLHPVNFTGKA